jgi:hypothetical protein
MNLIHPEAALFNIHFNIILPEEPMSSEISYLFNFPEKRSELIYYASNSYTFHQSHSLLFDSIRFRAEDEL